ALAATLALLLLTGCAAFREQVAAEREALLLDAGFKRVPLEAGETQHLHQLVDAEFCRCRYVGGEKEFVVYRGLRKARLAF
ncbi:MAG: hypothetical protein ACREVB_04720, partial [Burkholderiales bacterium]